MDWPPLRDSEASESLYGGQFTLSIQLIKPNYLIPLMPVLVLITHIIHRSNLLFVVAQNKVFKSNTWKKT